MVSTFKYPKENDWDLHFWRFNVSGRASAIAGECSVPSLPRPRCSAPITPLHSVLLHSTPPHSTPSITIKCLGQSSYVHPIPIYPTPLHSTTPQLRPRGFAPLRSANSTLLHSTPPHSTPPLHKHERDAPLHPTQLPFQHESLTLQGLEPT